MHEFADEPPIERRVGNALAEADETVAVAESFTGGLVGALLTEVPGSSEYFDRSLVTYTFDAKEAELGIDRRLLEAQGAVNATVAEEMARGVLGAAGTTWGVSTTGIAGPENGHEKPVGTVYVGIARDRESGGGIEVLVERYAFDGARSQIKERGARRALADLLAAIDGSSD